VTRRQRDRPPAPSRHSRPRRLCWVLVLAWLATVAIVGTAGTASGAVAPDPDREFVSEAYQLNLAIIATAEDAQANGRTSCVRRLATTFETAHRELDGKLRPVAELLDVPLSSVLSGEQRQQLAALRDRAGSPGYDDAWLTVQEEQHQRAVALIDDELRRGRIRSVREAAQAARPVVAGHWDSLRGGTCRAAQRSYRVPSGDGGQVADAWRLRRFGGLVLVGTGLLVLAGHAVTVLRRRTRTPGG
jgi:predicted outer membrane protein